jgi:hypothetical protein
MPRPARCHNCHRLATLTNHLCPACQAERAAQADASRYASQINRMASSLNDWGLISYMLSTLIVHTRAESPLILQAVLDRVEDLPAVTYPAVAAIAQEQTRALGFDIPVR